MSQAAKPPFDRTRGALSNPAGRFETLHRQGVDDGWAAEDDEPRPVPTQVAADPARTLIQTNKSPDINFRLSINPYRGCEHGCIYCFARPSHSYLNLSPGLDFETKLFYKADAAALFEQELRKPSYVCQPITLGANTDPYQPIEKEQRVTRSLLEVAQRFRQPVFLVTKGAALMERDLDLLGEMGRAGLAGVAVSITSLDDEIKRTLEPRAASPARRLRLVRQLSDAGVPVTVLVAPVIPFITDAEMEDILRAARDAGARSAGYVLLRLPWEVKDLFKQWLETHFPLRATHVMSLMRQLHGGPAERTPAATVTDPDGFDQRLHAEDPAAAPDPFRRNPYYDSDWGVRQTGRGPYAELLAKRFKLACQRLGYDLGETPLDTSQFQRPAASGDQLGLDF